MKEIKAQWGTDIVDAYHQVLLSSGPSYTEFNGVYITNVPPQINGTVTTEELTR